LKTTSRKVTIVLADQDPAFRNDLRFLLEGEQHFEIAGEASDPESAAGLIAEVAPQVVLLDYMIHRELEERGLPRQQELTAGIHRIVMVKNPEKKAIIESFRLGAQGIVLKESARRIWGQSIRAVISGQYWLGSETLALLIQAIREAPASGTSVTPTMHYDLTPREIEIVQKIAEGRSNKEVGLDFSIQERTVKHHLTNIFQKVGVSSRLELALLVRDRRMPAVQVTSDRILDRDEP
jgi:two-component system, NarL family, nitrate/nitrite response regulator NarL